MNQLEANDGVVVDETGVNIAMARQYGRAPKGDRVHTSAPVNTGKHVTVLGARSRDGMLAAMTIEGRTDTQVFLTLVQTILVPTWRCGQIVIMDNLSSHQVNGVKEARASVGAISTIYPRLLPIALLSKPAGQSLKSSYGPLQLGRVNDSTKPLQRR